MELTPAQKQIAIDLHRFRVCNCGRRFGKSFLASYEMLGKAVCKPNQNVAYIANTYQQARDIMWNTLLKIARPVIVSVNESRLEMTVKTQGKGTSRISLRGWESIETLRGQQFQFLVVDEIASMRRWALNWAEIIRPTLTDTKGEVLFLSTPKGYNEFYQLCQKELTDPDYKTFHFSSYDNPNLPIDEIDKAKTELEPDTFAQEYLAEFRKMSGLVYKEFDRKLHMVDLPEFDNNWSFTRAIDFGFEHNTACGWFATSPEGKTTYLYDLLYLNRINIDDLANAIKQKDGDRLMVNPVADSASPLMIDELKRKGVSFNPVIKSPDSVKNGIQKVSSLLQVRNDTGKPNFMIKKELVAVAEEFENYHWLEHSGIIVGDNPVKELDDILDMIRYFVISRKEQGKFVDPNKFSVEGW